MYDDVADSVKLAAYEKLLGDGSLPPPGIPTEPTRQARERERQRRKAEYYANDLVHDESPILHDECLQSNSFTVDPHCTHWHDKRAKNRVSSERSGNYKSAYDDSASSPSGLSQSSSDENDMQSQEASNENTQRNRIGRYRKSRRKQFLKNLSKAKRQRTRISVASSQTVNDFHRIFSVASAQVQDHSVTYEVNICTQPSCSCPEGLKVKKERV